MSTMRPGPLVIKLSGSAVEAPATRGDLWAAIARAHESHAGGVVVVHGGGNALDAHLTRLGMATVRRDGIRLTPPDQMAEVAAVLAGKLNKALVGAMLAAGAMAVGVSIGDGGAVRCAKTTRYGFDAGQVGEVVGGDGRLLRVLLEAGYLPVLNSVGIDDAGALLNVNADDAAVGVAGVLGATALVLLTDVKGVLDGTGAVIEEIGPGGADELVRSGVVTGGMIPKVHAAAAGASRSGSPAIIASYNDPAGLVRLARGEAFGTRILPAGVVSSS